MYFNKFLAAFLLFALILATGPLRAVDPAAFADGERVMFLGDSISRSGNWHSLISLFYETRFSGRHITWLNAGISGDTAAGALQRLQWDVLDRKPSTVVIMFGMNECGRSDLPGLIGSDQRVALFRNSMIELVQQLKKAAIHVVLCTPSPSEATAILPTEAKPEINAALTRCAKEARRLAEEQRIPLVDFNGPMNRITADFQKTNPSFTLIGNDRTHPCELGCTVMAYLFLKAQNVPGVVSETVVDAGSGQLVSASNAAVTDLKLKGGEITFSLLENALPVPFEGRWRQGLRLSPENELGKAMQFMKNPVQAELYPGWHCIPFQDRLNRELLQVTNLADGNYELLIDDLPVGQWGNGDLTRGINLAGVRGTPQYKQALQVGNVNEKRHQASSGAPRAIAFTRLCTLQAAGVDTNDNAAVQAAIERLIKDPGAATNPKLGSGGFAQTMAKRYFDNLEKQAELTTMLDTAVAEGRRVNRPVPHHYCLRPLAHPLPVAQRQAAFAARHDPEQVEKTAKEFLDLLVLDGPGLFRSNLRLRKGFQAVADLARANKPVDTLNAWRDYFFDKLRNPAAYGLGEDAFDPYHSLINVAESEKILSQASELMQGKLIADAAPMPPGAVWLPVKGDSLLTVNPWRPSAFQPLAAAFLLTGERRYLEKWLAYLDDWAMHETADAGVRPTDLPDNTNSFTGQIPALYQILGGIARMSPQKQSDFPPDTLARILSKLIRVYPTAALVYFESNPQNWTPLATTALMKSAMFMDEFKAAEYLFNRGRHRQENYATTEGLPDGSEVEHALWYNRHVFTCSEHALELAACNRGLSAYKRLSWCNAVFGSPAWEDQQRTVMTERGRYLLQMLTPQSQNPIGNRNDHRLIPGIETGEEFELFSRAPDLRVLTETLRGNTAGGLPEFTQSAFPYGGSWIMRTGWGKEAGYGHFFCTPFPSGGHALPGLKGNNGFYLSHAGQDLLAAGNFGNYSYGRSPLWVDGKEQFALAGSAHAPEGKGHKGFGIAYIDPAPAPWRSHSSPQFDFAEGNYAGPYGDFIDDHHDAGALTSDFLAERARAVITGVSHHRQVFFVKDPGLWIVVDRVQSREPHQYSLDWELPVAPIRTFDGSPSAHHPFKGKILTPETIQIDPSRQSVTTVGANMANVSIRHFGPEMKFSTERDDGEAIKNDYTVRYKLYDHWRIKGNWQSSGNDLMISLIEAIPADGASKIQSTDPLGNGKVSRGFKAMLADGHSLVLLTSVNGDAELAAGDISTRAESLLIHDDHGIVLGCKIFQCKQPAVADFEFATGKTNTCSQTPIYRPISPVRIEPACNVIAGSQPVTLLCATDGVEIHYTLDGSEPSLQAPLYAGPFTIDNTVIVKARAFRPGLTRLPGSLAGTHATVTAVAHYTLQKPFEPVATLGDKKVTPGLKAEYAEGDWKDLVFFPHRVKPQKTYLIKKFFEHCTPNPEKVFGWTYSGFLAIPEDGIYTFHAPQELVTARQEPGYALRLFLGQERHTSGRATGSLNEWYPATTRHGYGTWSIALKKGLHPFRMVYVDYRTDAPERFNHPGMREQTMWDGIVPQVLISGPGLQKQAIPNQWFFQP